MDVIVVTGIYIKWINDECTKIYSRDRKKKTEMGCLKRTMYSHNKYDILNVSL